MNNSNQRTIFNDANPIFGTLASNSLKDLKFVWEKRKASKTPAAAVDIAGTESDDLELRDVGRASGARGPGGLARGRERGTGSRIKARAVRLQSHEVGRQAPRLVTTRTTGQLEVPLEHPLDRPAKRIKHVSKDGKVVSVALGP